MEWWEFTGKRSAELLRTLWSFVQRGWRGKLQLFSEFFSENGLYLRKSQFVFGIFSQIWFEFSQKMQSRFSLSWR